jgi:hypothetical protein
MLVVVLLLLGKAVVMALNGFLHGIGVVALVLYAGQLVALVEDGLAQVNGRLR